MTRGTRERPVNEGACRGGMAYQTAACLRRTKCMLRSTSDISAHDDDPLELQDAGDMFLLWPIRGHRGVRRCYKEMPFVMPVHRRRHACCTKRTYQKQGVGPYRTIATPGFLRLITLAVDRLRAAVWELRRARPGHPFSRGRVRSSVTRRNVWVARARWGAGIYTTACSSIGGERQSGLLTEKQEERGTSDSWEAS